MELLGTSEAARRLRVHPFTLVRWDARGILTPMRDSAGRRLYLAETIEALAQKRRAQKGKVDQ